MLTKIKGLNGLDYLVNLSIAHYIGPFPDSHCAEDEIGKQGSYISFGGMDFIRTPLTQDQLDKMMYYGARSWEQCEQIIAHHEKLQAKAMQPVVMVPDGVVAEDVGEYFERARRVAGS